MKFNLRQAFLILFISQLILSSCFQKMILNNLGAFEDTVPLKYITNGGKKIIFFPMHHIGTKTFYDDAKNKIDSLITKGYVVYYENVRTRSIRDSLQKDTLYRKARKISGVDFATAYVNKGYIDTTNNTLFGKKTNLISKYKLINQSKTMFPLDDTLRVKNVDADFDQLIKACENKYGTIVLDKYDYETKFGEKYKHKRNKELYEYFGTGFRNTLITDSILKDPNNKIILVYGSKHFEGILEDLIIADKNYKQVEKF